MSVCIKQGLERSNYATAKEIKGGRPFRRIHGEVFQTFVEYRMDELVLVDSMR